MWSPSEGRSSAPGSALLTLPFITDPERKVSVAGVIKLSEKMRLIQEPVRRARKVNYKVEIRWVNLRKKQKKFRAALVDTGLAVSGWNPQTPWWLTRRWQNIHRGRTTMSLVNITSVCHVWTTFWLMTTFLSHNTASCPPVLVAGSALLSLYSKINERWTGSSGRVGSQCEGSLCQTSCLLEIDQVWIKWCQLVISNNGRTIWLSGAFEKLQGFPRACLLNFSTSLTNSPFFCSLPPQCSLHPCKIYCASLTKRVLSNWENGCVYQDCL